MMFKLLFLKKLYGLSDESLIQNCCVNMAYKYFLDLDSEDGMIDSSLLTRFCKTRITGDILEEMLKETCSGDRKGSNKIHGDYCERNAHKSEGKGGKPHGNTAENDERFA